MTTADTENVLTLERTYDCTPEELWEAWTDPAQFAKWFNAAPGIDAVVEELDVRVGGKMAFIMQGPDGEKYPNSGEFTAVDKPNHLATKEVMGDQELHMKVDIKPVGDKTHLTITQIGLPREHHEMAREGWGAILDKLGGVVES